MCVAHLTTAYIFRQIRLCCWRFFLRLCTHIESSLESWWWCVDKMWHGLGSGLFRFEVDSGGGFIMVSLMPNCAARKRFATYLFSCISFPAQSHSLFLHTIKYIIVDFSPCIQYTAHFYRKNVFRQFARNALSKHQLLMFLDGIFVFVLQIIFQHVTCCWRGLL